MTNGNIIGFVPVIAVIYLMLIHSLFLSGNGETEFLLTEEKLSPLTQPISVSDIGGPALLVQSMV